jgi:hypothetical protein
MCTYIPFEEVEMRETKIVVQAIQKYLKSHVLLYSNLKRVKRHRASYHTQMSEMK